MSVKMFPYEKALRVFNENFEGLDSTALEAHILLTGVSRRINDLLEVFYEKHGLSRARFMALGVLFASENRSSKPSDLAEIIGVTRATMTGTLDLMEREDLVSRTEAAGDRRAVEIKLTPKGLKLIRKLFPKHFERVSAMMGGITESDRKSLASMFKKIDMNLAKLSD